MTETWTVEADRPPEAGEAAAVALHESAHAVAARVQNLGVVHAVAAGKNCGVRTRYRRPRTSAEAVDTLSALAIVDLAGPAAEKFYLDEARRDAEWRIDEQNASSRAAAIVRLHHGIAEDVELTAARRSEVGALLADLRARAAELVAVSGPSIQRVAVALAAGKPLKQVELDALIGDTGDGPPPKKVGAAAELPPLP